MEITLGQWATINQCEMLAILRAAELMVGLTPHDEVIYFYSDSLSTLLKLDSDTTKSKLTKDTNSILNNLGLHNQVILYKVKANVGIPGNERADELAKSAASTRPIGPEPFLYISWSTVITKLIEDSKLRTFKLIQNHDMKENLKKLLTNYLSKNSIKPCSANRKSMRELTHMFTGQNWLGSSHNKRNPDISPHCNHCVNVKETAEHFIGDCPAYALQRIQTFGVPYSNFADLVANNKTDKIVHFLNITGRLKNNYYPEREQT